MKRSSRILVALAVAAVVLLCGSSLIRLGSRYQGLLEQAEAEETTRTASRALGRELNRLLGAVYETGVARLLEQDPPDWEVLETGGSGAFEGLEGVVIGHENELVYSRGRKLSAASVETLKADASQLTAAQFPSVIGPYRTERGEWLIVVVVARSLAFDTHESPRPEKWLGALVDLSQVVRASKVEQIVERGFDFELSALEAATAKKRIVSRSTERELDAALTETVDFTNERWTLTVSRRDAEGVWHLGGVKTLIVCALALVFALATYDFSGRLERLQREVDKRTARLRDVNQRLMAETHNRIEAKREFAHASFHDPVSGLPNRRYLTSRLERTLLDLRRQEGSFLAVLIVSLDGFRRVSESLGHTAADELLIQAARRIEGSLRPSEIEIARLASDELAVLLSNLSTNDSALAAAERLRENLAQSFQIESQTVFVTATIGLTVRSSGFEKAEELIREADIALSRARSQGRARVAVFDRRASEEMTLLRQLEMGLHEAVEREEFTLLFQPIVSLATGQIAGMETLIRWQHPLQGLIGPDKFVRLAEELEIIGPITRWVIKTACAQAHAWRETLSSERDFYLSVNLSGQDMVQPSLCDFIAEMLRENQLPSKTLRLEVTEGAMIDNFKAASGLAARLRSMGVPLLLDDFGTGYSSLSYLHRLHVDYLKIDRSFIQGLSTASDKSGIVRSIVQLAENFGISTIAEGVETLGDLVQLKEFGCPYGQGYYFSRPMTAEVAGEMLRSSRTWYVGLPPRVARQRA